MRLKIAVAVGLGSLLIAMVVTTTALKARNDPDNKQIEGLQLPVIAKQLPAENGVIPVELQCGKAQLTAPSELKTFSCVVKNNTNKNIIALSAAYTVIFENNGKEYPDTGFLTIETFIHPDFYKAHIHKAIPPGGERVLQPAGPTDYEANVIKGVKLEIDYVEFEDKTTLGPNENGSRIITGIREGAAKYKEWLVQKYIENGRSISAVVSLLQASDVPNEFGFKDTNHRQGVKIYRNHIRDVYKAHGAAELEKYLNQ